MNYSIRGFCMFVVYTGIVKNIVKAIEVQHLKYARKKKKTSSPKGNDAHLRAIINLYGLKMLKGS